MSPNFSLVRIDVRPATVATPFSTFHSGAPFVPRPAASHFERSLPSKSMIASDGGHRFRRHRTGSMTGGLGRSMSWTRYFTTVAGVQPPGRKLQWSSPRWQWRRQADERRI